MNASIPRAPSGEQSYLDVRYAEEKRPFTDYPDKLTHYLSERYLLGYRGARRSTRQTSRETVAQKT